jgi:hypothetical protein
MEIRGVEIYTWCRGRTYNSWSLLKAENFPGSSLQAMLKVIVSRSNRKWFSTTVVQQMESPPMDFNAEIFRSSTRSVSPDELSSGIGTVFNMCKI